MYYNVVKIFLKVGLVCDAAVDFGRFAFLEHNQNYLS